MHGRLSKPSWAFSAGKTGRRDPAPRPPRPLRARASRKPRGPVPQPILSEAWLPGEAGNTTVLFPFRNTRWWIWAWIARGADRAAMEAGNTSGNERPAGGAAGARPHPHRTAIRHNGGGADFQAASRRTEGAGTRPRHRLDRADRPRHMVGEPRAPRRHNAGRYHVFRGDQLDLVLLAVQFLGQPGRSPHPGS